MASVVTSAPSSRTLPFVKPQQGQLETEALALMEHWFGTAALDAIVQSGDHGARTVAQDCALSISSASSRRTIVLSPATTQKIDYVTSLFGDISGVPRPRARLAITSTLATHEPVVLALSILSIAPLILVVRAQTLSYASRVRARSKGLGPVTGASCFAKSCRSDAILPRSRSRASPSHRRVGLPRLPRQSVKLPRPQGASCRLLLPAA